MRDYVDRELGRDEEEAFRFRALPRELQVQVQGSSSVAFGVEITLNTLLSYAAGVDAVLSGTDDESTAAASANAGGVDSLGTTSQLSHAGDFQGTFMTNLVQAIVAPTGSGGSGDAGGGTGTGTGTDASADSTSSFANLFDTSLMET